MLLSLERNHAAAKQDKVQRRVFALVKVCKLQPIDAYTTVSGASLQWFKEMDGKQPGNPAKAAQAIIQAVESLHPPMRLALGTDAMSLIQEKLEWVKMDLDAWQQVTVSTDYTDRDGELIVR